MCRMFLSHNAPLLKSQWTDLVHQLYYSPGGGTGGYGLAYYEHNDDQTNLVAVKNHQTPSFAQLGGTLSILSKESNLPFMFHLRGPKTKTYHNHPHGPDESDDTHWHIAEDETYSCDKMLSALIHNGDIPKYYLQVEPNWLKRPERYRDMIDTQLIAFLVGKFGMLHLATIPVDFGSVIYTYPSGDSGVATYRILSSAIDSYSLYLLRWDESRWMIISEKPDFIGDDVHFTRIDPGVHKVERIVKRGY